MWKCNFRWKENAPPSMLWLCCCNALSEGGMLHSPSDVLLYFNSLQASSPFNHSKQKQMACMHSHTRARQLRTATQTNILHFLLLLLRSRLTCSRLPIVATAAQTLFYLCSARSIPCVFYYFPKAHSIMYQPIIRAVKMAKRFDSAMGTIKLNGKRFTYFFFLAPTTSGKYSSHRSSFLYFFFACCMCTRWCAVCTYITFIFIYYKGAMRWKATERKKKCFPKY